MKVSADNFVRAETHRMMAGLRRDAGGVTAARILVDPRDADDLAGVAAVQDE